MLRSVTVLLCLAMLVAGCSGISQSWINPLNWFGSSTVVPTQSTTSDQRPLVAPGEMMTIRDERILVPDITELVIEQTSDGAIIRASAVAPQQGYYNAELVRRSLEDGVLTYEFRATPPPAGSTVGSVASRTLNVATSVANTTLSAVRTVQVVGDTTTRVVRR